MPFYANHVDAGALAGRAALAQREIDSVQDALAEVIFERVTRRRLRAAEPLSVARWFLWWIMRSARWSGSESGRG